MSIIRDLAGRAARRGRSHRHIARAIAEALESRVYLSLSPVIAGNPSASEGLPYTLSLNANATGGSVVDHWTINWGDGSASSPDIQTVTGNPGSVTHTFTSGPDTYDITASTTDQSTAYNSNAESVLIQPLIPILSLSDGSGASVNEASPYTLNFSASYPSSEASREAITSWAINWGDGTSGSPDIQTISGDPTGGSAQHTYMTAGRSIITVTATDAEGIQVSSTLKSVTASSLNMQVAATDGGFIAGYANGSSTMSLALLNSNGTLGSFGGGTSVNLPAGFVAQALGIQIPNGNTNNETWVTGGSQGNAFALFFYNDSNSPVDGVVSTTTFGSNDVNDSISSLAVESNEDIIAVGDIENSSAVGLVQYNPNGTLDTSFGPSGSGGKVILSNFSGAAAPAVALESNDILVAGESTSGDFILRALHLQWNPGHDVRQPGNRDGFVQRTQQRRR